ncbi:MAG: alcohol dehydrogenase [Massilia sp.]|nr:alcohol dehydrogenase [Massilia sp.]
MKRIALALLTIAVLGLAALAAIEFNRADDGGQASAPVADAAAQVRAGAYLARIGNCMGCHTVRGGREYAGGRALATPFGNIYAPNLTADKATGIGAWTADDFWQSMHNGRSKDGSFLYPAFPYPNYTKVTRVDADALFAYLQTVAPVVQPNRAHELDFPYNQRILLPFWRAFNFRQGEYQAKPRQGGEWNRGAYLVQGLGHCSACHTGRNAMGGSIAESSLGGGMIPMQDWYAPPLGSTTSSAETAALLQTGVSARGAVFGPMAEVVAGSLQHASAADIRSIAAYLATLPVPAAAARTTAAGGGAQEVLRQGARLYAEQCAQCHGDDGKGQPAVYPSLAASRAVAADNPVNTIRMVLNGGYPPGTRGNPRPYGMPPFGTTLSDTEVAAVVSHLRASWGNQGAPVAPREVSRLRGVPAE